MELPEQDPRAEFARLVTNLCTAYDRPVVDRVEVMWKAFGKLRISEFARLVEHCMGPDAPERFPTVAALWRLRKQLNAGKRASTDNAETAKRLSDHILRNVRLTDLQRTVLRWSFIGSAETGEIIGVIVPRDPNEPERYPGVRVMVTELSADSGKAPAYDAAHCLAQRVMLHWLYGVIRIRGGNPLPEATLQAVIRAKQELTETYRLLQSEHDPEVDHRWFERQFRQAADRVANINREDIAC